jgi:cysteine-rich repeat protein
VVCVAACAGGDIGTSGTSFTTLGPMTATSGGDETTSSGSAEASADATGSGEAEGPSSGDADGPGTDGSGTDGPGSEGSGGSSSSGESGPAAMCGDGIVDAGEACDDAGETASCDIDCTLVECGDGVLNVAASEACDDAGDSVNCDDDCTPVECGDGHPNAAAGEACDGGGETASCDPDCSLAVCGDGATNAAAGEECDDGGVVDGDGCSSGCLDEFVAPTVCQAGNYFGVQSGEDWVVCDADASTAWISANSSGVYEIQSICQSLGYATVSQWGGTCGNVCGYCEGGTSCASPGQRYFDGSTACNPPATHCYTVMWECSM